MELRALTECQRKLIHEGAEISGNMGEDWTYRDFARASGVHLRRVKFYETNLRGCSFDGRVIAFTNFSLCDLRDVNFTDVDFHHAHIDGCRLDGTWWQGMTFECVEMDSDLTRAGLIIGGRRADGYEFFLTRSQGGAPPRVRAGCRDLTIADARTHWEQTRGLTPLGLESQALVDHLERVAIIRSWIPDHLTEPRPTATSHDDVPVQKPVVFMMPGVPAPEEG